MYCYPYTGEKGADGVKFRPCEGRIKTRCLTWFGVFIKSVQVCKAADRSPLRETRLNGTCQSIMLTYKHSHTKTVPVKNRNSGNTVRGVVCLKT